MTYKALYRKYRPNDFESIVGQMAIVKTLQNIVKENKISHAYLFNGPRGTGKTSAAKVFAKAINCLEPSNGTPCGKCVLCKQIENEEVNDIIEIDAASNNGVDEIRDLKGKINLAPTCCKYKVYIIDEVHMLSIGAFNALLKTLEEPPHHIVFILATTEMHKLPLTIISRCQNFNFKKITEDQMKIRLRYIISQENIKIEDAAIDMIVRLSDGGMRDAIGLLEQLFSFTNNDIKTKDVEMISSSIPRGQIVDLIKDIFHSDIEQLFEKIESFYQDGKDFIKITEDLMIFLKDVLLYKKSPKYFDKISNYEVSEYKELIDELNEDKIFFVISEFSKAIGDLKISNHPKIIFEIMLLKLIDKKKEFLNNCEAKTNDGNKNETSIEEDEQVDVHSEDEPTNKKAIESEHSGDENNNIKVEKEDQNKMEETDKLLPKVDISMYKKILINNTLAEADKKLLADIKNKCEQLQTFVINKDFKQVATILLDGNIVGVSFKTIIFTYPYDVMVEKADEALDEIEKLIENIVGTKMGVINILKEDWLQIRPYYIKLVKEKGKIDILDEIKQNKEKGKIKKKSKEIETAINMFGEDIIEIK